MASTDLVFRSRDEHRAWVTTQASLPAGFRVGTTSFAFTPREAPKPARMTITLLALDSPTPDFAALFTKNAFPGAPVLLGRRRLDEPTLGAVVINNKISNVGAPGGLAAAEAICTAAGSALGLGPGQVLPSSTGVIGWSLPADAMIAAVPAAVAALSPASALPAAEGIMTTDLYPKIRRVPVGAGSVVGIAKGAGMVEPNLATMLVYVMTDLRVPREALRSALAGAVSRSFNCISIDSDTSTSDTVVALSSGVHPCPDLAAFGRALDLVCADLAEDVVRNGEGVRHVLRVHVTGAPTAALAHGVGKAIVNSPLVKTAVCGNDPNVGRLAMALGKHAGAHAPDLDLRRARLAMAGHVLLENGAFRLDPEVERALSRYLKERELYATAAPPDGIFRPPIDYPPHERCVELDVDLGAGAESAVVLGADLTHEYVSENADYRS